MPFSDPITAGDVLVRNAIQSDNFVAGASGWRIQRGGNAEFNNLTARGIVAIVDAAGNKLELNLVNVNSDIIPVEQFTLAGHAGFAQVFFEERNASPLRSLFTIAMYGENLNSAKIYLREPDSGLPEIVVNRDIVAEQPASIEGGTPEVWHGLAFDAGWSDLGGAGNDPGQYRMMPDGTVMLRGVIKGGTTADFTQIAHIPAAYRPGNSKQIRVVSASVGSYVIVAAAGGIFCVGLGAATNLVLDGVRFELPTI